MADQTDEQKAYNTPVNQQDDMAKTAAKVPSDKSEQKVTRSTEGSVERTTSDARKS